MDSATSNSRLLLLILAIVIGAGSLLYTHYMVDKLKIEERNKVELWAKATQMIVDADTEQDLELLLSIIENNNTVPVILTEGEDNIIASVNFDPNKERDTLYMREQLEKMKGGNEPIIFDLGEGFINTIYYKDSVILTQLTYFPYIQLGIITIFIVIAYLAFNSAKKAEENQLWTSLSRETAHQLGTPTSSLAGWVEVLQEKYPDMEVAAEMGLDVKRLEKITERFAKVGTKPSLSEENIVPLFDKTIAYLRKRVSSKVDFIATFGREEPIILPVNSALFEWVIENLSKNAVDAMGGEGTITYSIFSEEKEVYIDISDTGKGIPKKMVKKIFKPGYTTKKHGWGLGLSLAKRIIEEYHKGKLFVKESEPGKGTVIRIVLAKG
ncbi:MAG: sensor histidine kinase [Bacteroidales bacterium]|jgi:anti-sigma regulatory factor (Ser/Thr protein kinase)